MIYYLITEADVPLRQCYSIILQVQNEDKKELTLQWLQQGLNQSLSVSGNELKEHEIKMCAKTQPVALMFKVYNPRTRELGMINGRTYFPIQPRIEGRFVHIYVKGRTSDL